MFWDESLVTHSPTKAQRINSVSTHTHNVQVTFIADATMWNRFEADGDT